MVRRSDFTYLTLAYSCTTLTFECQPFDALDAGTFWRIIKKQNVRTLLTPPTAFRSKKRQNPKGKQRATYALSYLRTLYSAGEQANLDTIDWVNDMLGVPVMYNRWKMETI